MSRMPLPKAEQQLIPVPDTSDLRKPRGGHARNPERLLICNGFTQALTLSCGALRAAGITRLAVEDPCALRYRQLAEAAGLTVIPVPCDQDGLRTDNLAASRARAALVTPAHQYPLGATMSAARGSPWWNGPADTRR
jgi:GntR family transcriptional regulator/MocR family aminotransferase